MKSITTFALACAVSVASAAGLAAAANPADAGGTSRDSMSGMMPGPAPGMMREKPMHGPSETLGRERPLLSLALQNRADLGLSAEQEKTLRQLVDRFGKEAPQRVRDIENAERELAGLLKQEPADLAQADDKVRAIEKLRGDLRLRRIHTIAAGRAALTPEQRVKLEQLAARQGRSAPGEGTRGAEEMQRFMNSERMPQAMNAMMAMAERMGGGDTMLGMVRMMEMMSMMGGDGMMESPPRSQPRPFHPETN
jgi:Spy/CpxP family protein refolding chaperone